MKNYSGSGESPERLDQILSGIRNRHFFALDLMLFCACPAISLWLRINSSRIPYEYGQTLAIYTLAAVVIRLFVFFSFGLYSRYWRYASIDELAQVVLAVATSSLFIVFVFFGLLPLIHLSPGVMPRLVPVLDGLLVLLGVGGLRYSVRLAERVLQRRRNRQKDTKRIAVIGAGDAGVMIVREMQANPQLGLEPVVFLDDDAHKHGTRIFGLPVVGNRSRFSSLVRDYHVHQVIIAMPTAPGKTIREFMALCREANLPVKTIPGIFELLDGSISVNQLRQVEIEDLLRREPVATDPTQVMSLLKNKRVIVTGAGGSIGNELCRQIARCDPASLVLLGQGENSLFYMTNELSRGYPHLVTQTIVADIRDADRMRHVFERCQPHVVFHAAAHKHVPLMEANAEDAITNNILGTRNLVQMAAETNVDRFVLVSTDKAVNPTSVMGCTKRVAELILQDAAARSGRCFVAVRFGNVLGSRGSVVPVLKQQIARGGPVTVTHPGVQRYFMTIPEAVQLVLQAATLGKGGEIFVLDMGKPIKIVDLARDLIRLSGLEEGRDIDIEYTGLRPGEKLVEELFLESDHYTRTQLEKIFVLRNGNGTRDSRAHIQDSDFESQTARGETETPRPLRSDLQSAVDALIATAQRGDPAEIRRQLQQIVPEYQPADFTQKATPQVNPPAMATTDSAATVSSLRTAKG